MWPFWIPSIAKALRAEKFWAKPTQTIISDIYLAFGNPNNLMLFLYILLLANTPPLLPTEIGISKDPLNNNYPLFPLIIS